MIKWVFVVVFAIGALWPSASLGQASLSIPVICRSASYLENYIRQNFEERMVGEGLLGNGATGELWVSEGGTTWSFLIRIGGGYLCLVKAGQYWKERANGIPILEREDR